MLVKLRVSYVSTSRVPPGRLRTYPPAMLLMTTAALDPIWLLYGCGLILLLQVAFLFWVAGVAVALRQFGSQGRAAACEKLAEGPVALGIAEERHGSRRLLRAILNGVGSQACLLDKKGYLIETNNAWDEFVAKLGDWARGGLGDSFTALCRSGVAYQDRTSDDLIEGVLAVGSGQRASFAIGCRSIVAGQELDLDIQLVALPAGDAGAVLLLQTDRTEERHAEQSILLEKKKKAETLADALEASQASLELAMRGGELGLWHWDVATGYFELSSNWLERLGRRGENLNADIDSFRDLMHEDELVFWSIDDAMSLAPDEPYDRQFRLLNAEGDYRWVQVLGKSTGLNPDGSPESLSGILIDIHDRKESELRDAGMAKIIEDSLNEVYVCDAETNHFLEVNRGARENLGYSMAELGKMTPSDLKVDMTPAERRELLRPLMEGDSTRIELETINRRADGTTYPVMLSLQKGRLMDRDVIVGIGIDLTQRRQLEQQLAEAQRLESIGQLAAGVAHEMSTPLQYVGNNIRFLLDSSKSLFEVVDAYAEEIDPDACAATWRERAERVAKVVERTNFERIRAEIPLAISDSTEGVERVLEIVRAMKEFSHPGDRAMNAIDLNQAIQSTVTVTRSRWKDAATLDLELDEDLPPVVCEGGAINQVFVNLIVNAADAIAECREQDPDAPEGKITIRSWAEGDNAIFEVEDNGCGMPESVRNRVFEPFYTTKEVGKGTGQGLSLSHTIVAQNHGGSLTAQSHAGEGTVLRMSLPIQLHAEQQDGPNKPALEFAPA